jgi:hypothetical protein
MEVTLDSDVFGKSGNEGEKAILTRLTLSRVCGAANTGSKRIHKKKVA